MFVLKRISEDKPTDFQHESESESSDQTLSLNSNILPEQKIQFKKTILKLKKTKSKQYKKKVLYMQPIIYSKLEINHQYLLFGFIEVESYYKDFASQWDVNLVSINNKMIRLVQIEKKKEEQRLDIKLESLGPSGLKDFQFLVDHYSKFSDQRYQNLAQQLQVYQNKTTHTINYLSEINDKIKSRIISEEEVQKAFEDYDIYFTNYVKKHYKESDFFTSGQMHLDFETQDVQQKSIHISFALLSLLGLEPEGIEYKFLRSNLSFKKLLGMDRLETTLRSLNFLQTDTTQFSFYQTYHTADMLTFQTTTNIEIVHWPDAPEWMEKYTCFGIISKLDISINQLKSIIEYRCSQAKGELNSFGIEIEDVFEYAIQSEIFLEKYYPEVFKDQSSKNSLKIKNPVVPPQ